MKKILQTDRQYNDNLNMYNKREGLSALLLFVIMCLGYAILGCFAKYIKGSMMTCTNIIFNTVISVITIILVKINKRNISTIGLKSGKEVLSIVIGGIFAAILFYNNCLSHLLAGNRLLPVKKIIPLVISFLSVAVCEEFVFRGYIDTRIYSLVKHKSIAVILTGILFILMHYPYRMLAYGMTLRDFFGNVGWIINLFVTHIVLSMIYMKTNSLYGAIIPHWVSNLAYEIVVR